jgi:hypothetical protein
MFLLLRAWRSPRSASGPVRRRSRRLRESLPSCHPAARPRRSFGPRLSPSTCGRFCVGFASADGRNADVDDTTCQFIQRSRCGCAGTPFARGNASWPIPFRLPASFRSWKGRARSSSIRSGRLSACAITAGGRKPPMFTLQAGPGGLLSKELGGPFWIRDVIEWKDRAFWNASSDAYQAAHGVTLTQDALAWGVWRIPESTLRILGDVQGRHVLELGCGAAQWARALIGCGARAVGVDLSEQQLSHARTAARSGTGGVAVVQADAERLPFQSEIFDIVFCDHGATVFAPPHKTVAEASRVLRPGGRFAF